MLPFLLVGFAPLLPLVGHLHDRASATLLVALVALAYGGLGVVLAPRLRPNWQDMSFFGMLLAGGFSGALFLFVHESLAAATIGALIGVQLGAFQGLAAFPITEAAQRVGRAPTDSVIDRHDRRTVWRRTFVVALFAVLLSPYRIALEAALLPALLSLMIFDVRAWRHLQRVARTSSQRIPYHRQRHGPLPSGARLVEIGLGDPIEVAIADADTHDPYRATDRIDVAVRGELPYALRQLKQALVADALLAVGAAAMIALLVTAS